LTKYVLLDIIDYLDSVFYEKDVMTREMILYSGTKLPNYIDLGSFGTN